MIPFGIRDLPLWLVNFGCMVSTPGTIQNYLGPPGDGVGGGVSHGFLPREDRISFVSLIFQVPLIHWADFADLACASSHPYLLDDVHPPS